MKVIETLVKRDYWSGEHRPYTDKWRTPTNIKVDKYALVKRLMAAAEVVDGDEFTITIEKTGERPFGDRRIILQEPHTYDDETDEQMTDRLQSRRNHDNE